MISEMGYGFSTLFLKDKWNYKVHWKLAFPISIKNSSRRLVMFHPLQPLLGLRMSLGICICLIVSQIEKYQTL